MGWCQEFAQQIQSGCDHLMVAGSDSCSCDVCGTVCPGKFRGCPAVWAAGPKPVVLGPSPRSASPTANSRPVKIPSYNGSRPALETVTGSAPSVTSPARTVPFDRSEDLPTLIAALGAEVRHLGRTLDSVVTYLGLSDGSGPSPHEEELVVQISQSMAAGLNEHRLTMERELQQVRRELLLHIDAVDAAPTGPPDNTDLLREIDRRFEWLVRSVSDRLVLIGNEVARLQRHVGLSPAPSGNGHPHGNGRVHIVAPPQEQTS